MQPEVEREVVRMSKSGDPRSYEPLVRAYEGPGLRFQTSMIQTGAAEMLCYGTGVVVEADD